MRNEKCKPTCKRVNFGWKSGPNMVSNYLNLLAIPTGFEPVTIGLEGRKPTAQFCGFSASPTVNGTRQFVEETHASVNGDDDG